MTAATFVVVLGVVVSAAAAPARENAGIVWAGASAIYAANVDGTGAHVLTRYYGRFGPDYFASPVWSQSGSELAYNTCDSGACLIQVFSRSAPPRTLRLDGLQVENNPTWAPDGSELAFAASESDIPIVGQGISAVSLATGRLRDITAAKYGRSDDEPAWSPDGTTIAFVRLVHEPVIYLVGADGRGTRWFTRGESPSWSPDGTQLVFTYGRGIFTIGSDGRGRTRRASIPRSSGEPLQPRWSPDGRKILYETRLERGRPGIWTMDLDGTHRVRVRTLPYNAFGANWTPG